MCNTCHSPTQRLIMLVIRFMRVRKRLFFTLDHCGVACEVVSTSCTGSVLLYAGEFECITTHIASLHTLHHTPTGSLALYRMQPENYHQSPSGSNYHYCQLSSGTSHKPATLPIPVHQFVFSCGEEFYGTKYRSSLFSLLVWGVAFTVSASSCFYLTLGTSKSNTAPGFWYQKPQVVFALAGAQMPKPTLTISTPKADDFKQANA